MDRCLGPGLTDGALLDACAVSVELNELRTRTDWVFNPSVMIANALTAFILNLVSYVAWAQILVVWGCFWMRWVVNVLPSNVPPPCPHPKVVFLLIGKTSALTMNIAGVIKDWMLIFFSWSVFKAPVTALNLAGYFFCCSGVRGDRLREEVVGEEEAIMPWGMMMR